VSPSAIANNRTALEQGVPLVDVDPEVLRFLDEDEKEAARIIRLPIRALPRSVPDVQAQLAQDGAFGAFVLEGLVAHEIQLADRLGVRLLGPGDLIVSRQAPQPLVLTAVRWVPASPVRLALLRNHMLTALQRWPRLLSGMYLRIGQQLDRFAAQLMLCQLPRVEDRVLGLMWLMAEPWGRVTASGTRLPVDLTHELIGMMIGARRPTVSLALSELADRGAMIRQEGGWLLLERPPAGAEIAGFPPDAGDLRRPVASSLTAVAEPAASGEAGSRPSDLSSSYEALQDALARLRRQHLDNVATFDRRMRKLRATREQCERTRVKLTRDRTQRLRRNPS
jgi:CRP-like cAMP-binding protein